MLTILYIILTENDVNIRQRHKHKNILCKHKNIKILYN